MILSPNEKDPQSDWISPPGPSQTAHEAPYPSNQAAYADSTYPAPGQSAYGTPSTGYYPPPQAGPAEYAPPQGPPPDYTSAQGETRSAYRDEKSAYSERESMPAPIPSGAYSQPHAPYGTQPVPAAVGSSSSGQESGGLSLSTFFGNKGSPPMWTRLPAGGLPYTSFPPMCLVSNGKDLSKGFPELPPPCELNPHPFATHDVSEEDWKRFLTDVKKAGGLTGAQRIKSNVLPMFMGIGFLGGFLMSNSIEKRMKYQNRGAAGDLVDHWNHYFFGPRRMEVVLCQASERLSGRVGAAPVGNPMQERMAYGLRRGDDLSSDDSSSEDERFRGHGLGRGLGLGGRGLGDGLGGRGLGDGLFGDRRARIEARRERRGKRRAAKREMREWKARGDNEQPYHLYVTATN